MPADTQVAGAKADELSAGRVEEEEVCLAGLTDGSKPGKEVLWDMDLAVDREEDENALELPPLEQGGDRAQLALETCSDKSLVAWRKLGDDGMKGFKWRDGLLYLTTTDPVFQAVDLLVLPAIFRKKILW